MAALTFKIFILCPACASAFQAEIPTMVRNLPAKVECNGCAAELDVRMSIGIAPPERVGPGLPPSRRSDV